jgi:hypothetical protein
MAFTLRASMLRRMQWEIDDRVSTPPGVPARCPGGQPVRLACRRRTSAATDATSAGTVVSTVISEPMPTVRSYLSIVVSVAVFTQWTSFPDRAL